MVSMTWEQKLQALQALSDVSLRMRKPGDWYVDSRMEIKDGPVLVGAYGNGKTPQAAVEDHWQQYALLPLDKGPIVVDAMRDSRRHVRWNGFMWQDVA
jgi:hypothetical protein